MQSTIFVYMGNILYSANILIVIVGGVLWCRVVDNWGSNLSDNWSSMVDLGLWLVSIVGWSGCNLVVAGFTTNDCVETGVLIGGVVDNAVETIRIVQTVRSLYGISITGFVLLLDITGLYIMNGVREVVFGWSLVFGMLVHGGGNSFHQSWGSMLMVHWSVNLMVRWMVVIRILCAGNSYEGETSDDLKNGSRPVSIKYTMKICDDFKSISVMRSLTLNAILMSAEVVVR